MHLDEIDGRFGEGWSGVVPNGSHVNVVVARRGSPTAAAIAGQMGATTPGHAPLLLCVGAGNLVRPATVVRNKSTVDSDRVGKITWGAAQVGLGQGVLDAVADGLIEEAQIDELVLMVAVWVDPAAFDHGAIKRSNREAVRTAIADALAPSHLERTKALIAQRDTLTNAFDQS